MTTITLPPEPRAVPALVVDPGSIDDCAAQLLAASAQIDDLGTYVAGGARIGDWSGRGGAAYHAAIGPIGRRADAMSLALRGLARRVELHATEMTGLETRRVDLDERCRFLGQQIALLRTRAAGAAPAEVPGIQADCDRVRQQVQALDGDVTTWIADVAAEEHEMSAAFRRVLDPDQVDRIYGGVADPADSALETLPRGATPEQVNTWWVGSPPSSRRRSSRPARDRSAISTASRRRPATTPTRWPSTATSPSGACWRTGASSPTRSAGGSTTRGPPTGRWTPSSNASTPSPERRSGASSTSTTRPPSTVTQLSRDRGRRPRHRRQRLGGGAGVRHRRGECDLPRRSCRNAL